MKSTALEVPPPVVTVTGTVPPTPAGTRHTISVSDHEMYSVARTLPKET